MANALWDRFARIADARAGDGAVFLGARVWRYDALRQAALEAAATLDSAFDLQPGQRVMVACQPGPEMLAWVLAIWHRGAIPALIHADSPPAHLTHARQTTAAALLVAETALAGLDGVPRVDPEQALPTGRAPVRPPADRTGTEPGSIVFTSGSSGRPKGVTQSGATLLSCSDSLGRFLGYTPRDRILCPVPFAFDYGWGQALSCLLQGVALVLPVPRTSFGLCDALERHRPTVLAGVPAVFGDLAAGLAPIRETDRSSLRLITNTGSKIPSRVFEELLELFPAAAISLNYGLTETYRSASLPVALARQAPDAVGHAVPGVTLSVLRPDGKEAAPDEEGEIVHHGLGTFMGYWNDPVRTAEVLRANPAGGAALGVHTGDLGRVGPDGLLRIHGRRDRQMKSMGIRVSPDEVEALLLNSGLVAEVGVIALPHDILGDMIVACVVPKRPVGAVAGGPPAGQPTDRGAGGRSDLRSDSRAEAEAWVTGSDLLARLRTVARQTMSQHMQPRLWLVFDALPRTRSGKVDYPALTRAADGRR